MDRKQIKEELLKLYRHYFAGNTNTAEGTDIRIAITKLEDRLKLDNKNR